MQNNYPYISTNVNICVHAIYMTKIYAIDNIPGLLYKYVLQSSISRHSERNGRGRCYRYTQSCNKKNLL